jgi:hypothetical protein
VCALALALASAWLGMVAGRAMAAREADAVGTEEERFRRRLEEMKARERRVRQESEAVGRRAP